jgi:hypothetical protein
VFIDFISLGRGRGAIMKILNKNKGLDISKNDNPGLVFNAHL